MIWESSFMMRVASKKDSQIAVTRGAQRGRIFPSKTHSEWHRRAKAHLFGSPRFGRCVVHIHIIFPDKRRADTLNKAQAVEDLLTDCGIIPDDCWQVIGSPNLSHAYRKGEGGFDLIIEGESRTAYDQRRLDK